MKGPPGGGDVPPHMALPQWSLNQIMERDSLAQALRSLESNVASILNRVTNVETRVTNVETKLRKIDAMDEKVEAMSVAWRQTYESLVTWTQKLSHLEERFATLKDLAEQMNKLSAKVEAIHEQVKSLLNFIGDPDNIEELEKLGLANKRMKVARRVAATSGEASDEMSGGETDQMPELVDSFPPQNRPTGRPFLWKSKAPPMCDRYPMGMLCSLKPVCPPPPTTSETSSTSASRFIPAKITPAKCPAKRPPSQPSTRPPSHLLLNPYNSSDGPKGGHWSC